MAAAPRRERCLFQRRNEQTKQWSRRWGMGMGPKLIFLNTPNLLELNFFKPSACGWWLSEFASLFVVKQSKTPLVVGCKGCGQNLSWSEQPGLQRRDHLSSLSLGCLTPARKTFRKHQNGQGVFHIFLDVLMESRQNIPFAPKKRCSSSTSRIDYLFVCSYLFGLGK